MQRLKNFWWAGWNNKRIAAQLAAGSTQLHIHSILVKECERTMRAQSAEIALLTRQTEHDALMLQAFSNWCAAHGCTPTIKDLEIASGKK